MTTIFVTCRRCGHEFAPARRDIVLGPNVYRRCRECGRIFLGDRGVRLSCRGVPAL